MPVYHTYVTVAFVGSLTSKDNCITDPLVILFDKVLLCLRKSHNLINCDWLINSIKSIIHQRISKSLTTKKHTGRQLSVNFCWFSSILFKCTLGNIVLYLQKAQNQQIYQESNLHFCIFNCNYTLLGFTEIEEIRFMLWTLLECCSSLWMVSTGDVGP